MDTNDRKENMDENLNKGSDSGAPEQPASQNNMKVGLYARVSTELQNLDTQLLLLRDFCQREGLHEVIEYVDVGSGATDKRPQFEQLLRAVRENRINCIVVYKLDRIGRSLLHLITLLEELKKRNVEFISLTQNINTTTPEGKLFFHILACFASFEREVIVSRTRAGLERARRQGKILGRPKGRKDKSRRKTSGYVERWKEWRESKKLSTNSHGK